MIRQDTKVLFRLNGDSSMTGIGKVVGMVNQGLPIVGRSYIIEPEQPLENEHYPYTHFVLPEIWFEVID